MNRRAFVLVPLVLACLYTPARAGILFNRSTKKTPTEQVTDLVKTLRTDADEKHRAAAAEDLSKFDAKAYPVGATALIDAVMKDNSSAVRFEATQALGKVRPISTQSAYALEYALTNDSSTRVRMAAKSALWQYHVAGYRGTAPAAPQTKEPSLAAAPRPAAPTTAARQPTRPVAPRQTNEPPLAAAKGTPGIRIDPPVPSPYTAAPSVIKFGPTTPIDPPAVKPEPAKPAAPAKPDDDGPTLIPPL